MPLQSASGAADHRPRADEAERVGIVLAAVTRASNAYAGKAPAGVVEPTLEGLLRASAPWVRRTRGV